ncbi:hypothetical protein ANANG_G00312790 [Anguilla anguilla]|uniref:Uncharacterized protein n=1 Tax=Anguilla anguilla TaxID=7936 RepID=A0A9D3RHW7_ANGAN|nr:hypothetical protein ANANG_G00312790 [Anguilla anguilla]
MKMLQPQNMFRAQQSQPYSTRVNWSQPLGSPFRNEVTFHAMKGLLLSSFLPRRQRASGPSGTPWTNLTGSPMFARVNGRRPPSVSFSDCAYRMSCGI